MNHAGFLTNEKMDELEKEVLALDVPSVWQAEILGLIAEIRFMRGVENQAGADAQMLRDKIPPRAAYYECKSCRGTDRTRPILFVTDTTPTHCPTCEGTDIHRRWDVK